MSSKTEVEQYLKMCGYVNPEDGCVMMWPHGDVWPASGTVAVPVSRMIDALDSAGYLKRSDEQ